MWVLDFADAKLYAYHAHPPADGALDASFSGDGKVTTDVTAGNDPGQAVAVQSDGKVLVAGFGTLTGGSQDFTLVRYNADGTPDSGFGTSGQVTTDFDSGADAAFGVAVQSDGKIVVAGFATVTGSGKDFALARYNDDGTLDDTFGTVVSGSTRSGKVTTPIASGTGAEELPSRWPCTPTARSWPPGIPSPTSPWSATTPTGPWTPPSAATARSPAATRRQR